VLEQIFLARRLHRFDRAARSLIEESKKLTDEAFALIRQVVYFIAPLITTSLPERTARAPPLSV
jgi:hypothetical protein